MNVSLPHKVCWSMRGAFGAKTGHARYADCAAVYWARDGSYLLWCEWIGELCPDGIRNTFADDNGGNRTLRQDPSVSTTYSYDVRNNVQSVQHPWSAPRAKQIDTALGHFCDPQQRQRAEEWVLWYRETEGVTHPRINQRQTSAEPGVTQAIQQLGMNRPDIQLTLQGGKRGKWFDLPGGHRIFVPADQQVRLHVELDTPESDRGWLHLVRILRNDPTAIVILQTIPNRSGIADITWGLGR